MDVPRRDEGIQWTWVALAAFSLVVGTLSLARYVAADAAVRPEPFQANQLVHAHSSLTIAIADFTLAIVFAALGFSPIKGNAPLVQSSVGD